MKGGERMTESDFLALFESHHNMVYRLAYASVRSAVDAEDITQTVFLKLLKNKNPIAPGKEKAWLAQVTVNACRDLQRSFWKRHTEPLDESIPCSDPEESALLEAVGRLPDKSRVVIHLHYYEGYNYEEIAEILHIRPSAVSMRLHRARNQLRSCLKEELDETVV